MIYEIKPEHMTVYIMNANAQNSQLKCKKYWKWSDSYEKCEGSDITYFKKSSSILPVAFCFISFPNLVVLPGFDNITV